jgi:Family of unknown function (DUF6441)
MAPKFKVTVDTPAWLKMIREKQRPVATAAVAALQEAAAGAVQEGRQNIAGAGRFRGKWLTGLRYHTFDAEEGGQPSLKARALIFHSFGIAGIFEHGGTIEGKPLLWIPTDPGARPASRSGKKLVSATVRGQPMLFDANDRDRHRKPLYIGVPSVRIPKKFRIIEIVKQHAKQLGILFLKHFKGD